MKFKINKKSLAPVAMISTIIVLIAVFVVIIIGLSKFDFTSNTIRQVCEASIDSRNSANLGKFSFKELVPLKCQTERVCLTDKFMGGCKNLISTQTNPVKYIRVKDKSEVANALADIIYQDYAMTGKGQLNFMPREAFSNNYCLFTSKITADPDAKITDLDKLTAFDLLKVMQTKKEANGISYLSDIYHINSLTSEQIIKLKQEKLAIDKVDYLVSVSFAEKGYITALAVGAGTGLFAAAAIVGIAATAEFSIPAGVAYGLIVGTGVGSSAGYWTLPSLTEPSKPISFVDSSNTGGTKDKAYTYLGPQLVPYTDETIDKILKCDSIATIG